MILKKDLPFLSVRKNCNSVIIWWSVRSQKPVRIYLIALEIPYVNEERWLDREMWEQVWALDMSDQVPQRVGKRHGLCARGALLWYTRTTERSLYQHTGEDASNMHEISSHWSGDHTVYPVCLENNKSVSKHVHPIRRHLAVFILRLHYTWCYVIGHVWDTLVFDFKSQTCKYKTCM